MTIRVTNGVFGWAGFNPFPRLDLGEVEGSIGYSQFV